MTEKTLQLLSGNEAIALGAYHSGLQVAAAYPGTPSTEILENLARFEGLYTEWSPNEKVATEVAMGAAYAGARAMASMKHVGLNVAADAFMGASITGISGGFVIITADDPQIHSSQNEQDNRHYARLGKVPMLEPSSSQDAYDLMGYAFDISEQFDTPILFRTTTRISHSKSVVEASRSRIVKNPNPAFFYNMKKYVMLPVNALPRHRAVEERMKKLAAYSETFPMNRIEWNSRDLGIITAGAPSNYAREIFPDASFLLLGMSWPLPEGLIRQFAAGVKKLVVVEELDPFTEDYIKAMGIEVTGKAVFPIVGELDNRVVLDNSIRAGLLPETEKAETVSPAEGLPKRPPLLCPGCPHTAMYYVLNTAGQRQRLVEAAASGPQEPKIIMTGDIGCYTLGALPPINVLDTTTDMGAGIGQAIGMANAGVKSDVVTIIGDSTFIHSGITGLIDAVYNKAAITVIILDNRTTAMTGHQEHPGTGKTIRGEDTFALDLEVVCRAVGVNDVRVINAFDLKALRSGLKESMALKETSVIIVRGACAVRIKEREHPRQVNAEACTNCGICLQLGCSAIQRRGDKVFIEASLCAGDICGVCNQLCPQGAISAGGDQ